ATGIIQLCGCSSFRIIIDLLHNLQILTQTFSFLHRLLLKMHRHELPRSANLFAKVDYLYFSCLLLFLVVKLILMRCHQCFGIDNKFEIIPSKNVLLYVTYFAFSSCVIYLTLPLNLALTCCIIPVALLIRHRTHPPQQLTQLPHPHPKPPLSQPRPRHSPPYPKNHRRRQILLLPRRQDLEHSPHHPTTDPGPGGLQKTPQDLALRPVATPLPSALRPLRGRRLFFCPKHLLREKGTRGKDGGRENRKSVTMGESRNL
ncbi:hypothetical protein NDU88_009518, partial [Pleurodeles waltl]